MVDCILSTLYSIFQNTIAYLPFLKIKMNILNHPFKDFNNHLSATEISSSLQHMMLKLKGKYLSEDGKTVDYLGLRSDHLFEEFENLCDQLTAIKLTELSLTQRKAFFINIYNTLTIHGLCRCDPLPNSVTDVTNFWKQTAYIINSLTFSLDDIEHGILRANKKHPSSISKPFLDSDPRLQFSMEELDPRIHFVLNCGAKSCPAVSVYNEGNLEYALNNAAISFLSDTFRISKNEIHLSKIFQWYGSDFGSNDKEILKWINPYLPTDLQDSLGRLSASDRFEIVYDEYDWLINATNK